MKTKTFIIVLPILFAVGCRSIPYPRKHVWHIKYDKICIHEIFRPSDGVTVIDTISLVGEVQELTDESILKHESTKFSFKDEYTPGFVDMANHANGNVEFNLYVQSDHTLNLDFLMDNKQQEYVRTKVIRLENSLYNNSKVMVTGKLFSNGIFLAGKIKDLETNVTILDWFRPDKY